MTAIREQIHPNADLTQTIISEPDSSHQMEINLERLLYSGDRSEDMVLEPDMQIVIPYGNFEVFLTWEVTNSRWVSIKPLTRFSELIADATTPYSSMRDITVVSQNGERNTRALVKRTKIRI